MCENCDFVVPVNILTPFALALFSWAALIQFSRVIKSAVVTLSFADVLKNAYSLMEFTL